MTFFFVNIAWNVCFQISSTSTAFLNGMDCRVIFRTRVKSESNEDCH
jgi:hypothetical protein